jgi:MauM/NapG family ferredoxin protein
MTKRRARTLRSARRASQGLFFAAFLCLFVRAGEPLLSGGLARAGFFALDPLFFLVNPGAIRLVWTTALVSLLFLALTWVFGRFFCGWVCPLGAVHSFFSWSFGPKVRTGRKPSARALRPKYLLLAGILTAAALGVGVGSWLDPISLLTRGAASAVHPALQAAVRPHSAPRPSGQAVLLGGLLILLVALNASRRRFFCRSLCPLGALYGLAARRGPFRMRAGADCPDCGLCSKACPYDGNPGADHLRSECVLCLNCAAECPRTAVSYGSGAGGREAAVPRVDLGRRRLIGAALTGAAAAVLVRVPSAAEPRRSRRFLRPPGAVAESDFLRRCGRCGKCVEACPTGFIQPAFLQAGVEGLWTPVLDARSGACEYECNRCTQVCPARAIETLTLAEKKRFKIGTAVVDKNRCYTHADGFDCTVCADLCPVPGNAIRFREAERLDSQGRRVVVRQVYVVPELCTGCGLCEHACPRGGGPGIVVTAEDEDREAPR